METKYTRRKFLKNTVVAGISLAGTGLAFSNDNRANQVSKSVVNQYDSKGLPTAVLGKTGIVIPRMAIGLGSRFLNIATLDEALEMCNYALDNGLYYWDTAHSYVNPATGAISEERLGNVVKYRRKEIFLSSKVTARDPEKAKGEIEESLKRLQTDHLDMLKVHSVESETDAIEICKKGGVLDLLLKLKEEGITRFIGFSGHANAQALRALIDTGRFDSMLFAMNHYGDNKDDRQGLVIPAAKKQGMGIMLMKAVRPKETIPGVNPSELLRFALTLEGPSGIVVGMDSKKVVDSNLNLLRNFKPMNSDEKKKYAMLLSPYFRHENLEWMKHGYHDGHVAS